jgi:tetratricopeptide (TPR) repeat protein
VENYFRLGDELFRIHRPDTAEMYFKQATETRARQSPALLKDSVCSPPSAGSTMLRCSDLKAALQHGSTSFLVFYIYAREQYQLTADAQDRHAPLKNEAAAEIRAELQKSLALMPDFGPAHELLGFFEMVQGENLALAEQHLQRAIQLEPENPACLFSLAQLQLRNAQPRSRAHHPATAAAAQRGRETPRPRRGDDSGNRPQPSGLLTRIRGSFGDEVEADFLGADGFAGAGDGAVAETFLVHLATMLSHAAFFLGLALRAGRPGGTPWRKRTAWREAFLHAATHAPQPMHAAASIA